MRPLPALGQKAKLLGAEQNLRIVHPIRKFVCFIYAN